MFGGGQRAYSCEQGKRLGAWGMEHREELRRWRDGETESKENIELGNWREIPIGGSNTPMGG
jgi:hypothetical protein